jgi:hypothetical protein
MIFIIKYLFIAIIHKSLIIQGESVVVSNRKSEKKTRGYDIQIKSCSLPPRWENNREHVNVGEWWVRFWFRHLKIEGDCSLVI